MSMQHEPRFSPADCPVEQLEWFVNQTLSVEERADVEAHLIGCAACRAEVVAWTEVRQALRQISIQTPEPRADLLLKIEQQIDALPSALPLSRPGMLLRACWLVLMLCGEHVRAQARLLRRDLFWMPLCIVPLAGSLVYLPSLWPDTPGVAAFLAALLTAFGMVFLYGQRVDPARELVLATSTSPRLVLGIRWGLIFGYDLLINCGLVLPFLAVHGVITPAWFLVNWLAPLCCLSAIALLVSILLNASTALVVCVLLWALRLFNSVQSMLLGSPQLLPEALWQQRYESFWHQGPLLFAIALLALILAFVVLERKEHFAQ